MGTELGGSLLPCRGQGAPQSALEVDSHNAEGPVNRQAGAAARRECGVSFLNMLTRISVTALLLLAVSPLGAQNGWFQPSLLEKPEVRKALQSVDERAAGIVDEWIRLVEIPAPSGKEQARAQYIRAEMEKLGLSEIRTDDIFNVSGVRKGTGGGPTVVFAAHMDTVFPEGTDVKVKREGDILRGAGHRRRHVEPDGHARNVPRARIAAA